MDFDLSPKFAQPAYQEEGGSFDTWYNSDFPLLGESKVGAGRLVLQPRGFVLPHYPDSAKIGYALEGEVIVGLVFPNSLKEVVVKLKKGDVLPVPRGVLSWWYNSGDSDFVAVFLGETSKAYVPGQPTYFLLSGGQGNLLGFSTDFTARAFKLNEEDANKLVKSQKGLLIVKVKLDAAKQIPQPCKDSTSKLVYNMETAPPDINVKGGGIYTTITAAIFPFLEEVGLSVSHLKMDANAMFSPTYTADGSVRLFYAAKGSGRVQVVGIEGKQVLDSEIVAGQLLIVPRYFSLAVIAGSEGLEFVSVLNSTSPAVEELATKNSVWNALSPVVSQVSLDVTPEFEQLFKSNIQKSSILIPPSE